MSPVRRSAKLGAGRASSRGARRRLAAVDEAVLGEGGELEGGRDEPVAQVGLGEDQAGGAAVQVGPQAREVVGGALGRASLRPGDDGRVAGAGELLELGLGLLERAAAKSAAWARISVGWSAEIEESRIAARSLSVSRMRSGLTYSWWASSSWKATHVGPVVAQARLDVLLGGDHDLRGPGISSSSSRKRSTGSSSAMSGRSSSMAAISASSRCSARARRRARSRRDRPRRGCAG